MKPILYNEVKDWELVKLYIKGMKPLIGKFTILRVQHKSVPKGYFAYDIRHSDEGDFMDMATIKVVY